VRHFAQHRRSHGPEPFQPGAQLTCRGRCQLRRPVPRAGSPAGHVRRGRLTRRIWRRSPTCIARTASPGPRSGGSSPKTRPRAADLDGSASLGDHQLRCAERSDLCALHHRRHHWLFTHMPMIGRPRNATSFFPVHAHKPFTRSGRREAEDPVYVPIAESERLRVAPAARVAAFRSPRSGCVGPAVRSVGVGNGRAGRQCLCGSEGGRVRCGVVRPGAHHMAAGVWPWWRTEMAYFHEPSRPRRATLMTSSPSSSAVSRACKTRRGQAR
jgi:hypothetical protein